MEKGAVIKHDLKKAPKTGDWKFMQPVVDKEKCIGCATCVGFCPEAAIEMESKVESQKSEVKGTELKVQKGKAEIYLEWCKGCGVCAQVCPVKAILMKKI